MLLKELMEGRERCYNNMTKEEARLHRKNMKNKKGTSTDASKQSAVTRQRCSNNMAGQSDK